MKASYRERISIDSKVMRGKPVIKGTRITVELILRKLDQGANFEDVALMYPSLTNDDILAAILYAADTIANEELILTER